MRLTASQLSAMPERIRSQIAVQMVPRPSAGTAPAEVYANEAQLHRAIWSALAAALPADAVAWHSANGERRDKATAAKLASMGVTAGVADLIILCRGRSLALEIKMPTGSLSGAQKLWRERWIRAGGEYAVVRSVTDALKVVSAWRAAV